MTLVVLKPTFFRTDFLLLNTNRGTVKCFQGKGSKEK